MVSGFGGDVIKADHKKLPLPFLPFILIAASAAASPDLRLISLVPPGAQLVAGISASAIQGHPHNFVLLTPNNWVDLQDSFALTGADDSRSIHQIVFVEVASKDEQPGGHSLLASGHFDQPRVFKSASDGGATVTHYRRIPIMEIQPFGRERSTLHDVRWLAVLDSSVLAFGSVSSTRLELDRYLSHTQADGPVLRRLAHLRSKDQTWCLLSASSGTLPSLTRSHEIHDVLAKLSPELAELAQSASELEFGVHYGRRVEFEYDVTFALDGASRIGDSQDMTPVVAAWSASLLPAPNTSRDANSVHGVILVSTPRYKEWLAQIAGR
jgi:hypothetical protein